MGFASKEQLQELMQYMGENIHVPQLVQHFDGENIYSTEEQIIGCWIDGRPIYQKSIAFGALPNKNIKKVAHGIANIKEIITVKATGYTTTAANWYNIPWATIQTTAGENDSLNIFIDAININVQTMANASAETISYITLQYTKTTDAANSFNLAKENDYCMQERVIGTWKDDVDNCLVYRKTYKFGLPTTGNTYDTIVETFNTSVYPLKVSALQVKDGSFFAASNSGYKESTNLWPAVNAYTDSSGKALHIAVDGFESDYYNVTFYAVVDYLKG